MRIVFHNRVEGFLVRSKLEFLAIKSRTQPVAKFRAFVSHSFLDVDKGLVEKFVSLLTEVENLHPQLFSWDRAIRSEARSLSERVVQKFDDKNVFIGICSRRERVFAQDPLAPHARLGFRIVREDALTWKTSDWIVQEIGFARGRDLKSILLVEEGVVAPQGIMGDIQYVRFERTNPEQCFVELMQMISSLPGPSNPAVASELPSESLPPAKGEVDNSGVVSWRYSPDDTWSAERFEMAL